MTQATTRKATNLTLNHSLLADAKCFNVNLSRAAEDGIRNAVRQAKELQWKEENRAALESSNAFVLENGLPLEKHRTF